jgi:hypothetical protein
MPRFALAFVLLAPLAAAADIEPGNWELTVSAAIVGAPPLPAQTRTQCLEPQDARDPARVFGPNPDPTCSFSNKSDTGSEFSFTISCSGPVPVNGSGRVRYGAGTMSADMELHGEANGQKFSTTSHVSGRRLGPCH